MALKATYKTQAEIPDVLREFYAEQDGIWVLDAEVREHPGARAVKSALDAQSADNKKLRDRLAAFEGVDPDEARQLKVDRDTAETDRQKKAGEFDALQKKRDEAHAKEIDRIVKAAGAEAKVSADLLASRERFIRKVVLENEARKTLGGKVLSVELVLPHVMKQLDAVEDPETGEWRPVVLDKDGKTHRIADGKGTPFTMEALVEEMGQQEQFAPAWKGTGANGSGIPIGGGAGGQRGVTTIAASDERAKSASIDDIASGKVVVK